MEVEDPPVLSGPAVLLPGERYRTGLERLRLQHRAWSEELGFGVEY